MLPAVVFHRTKLRLLTLAQGHVRCLALALELVTDKAGLEIGGPSQVFSRKWMPIYSSLRRLDNCDFSNDTTWVKHEQEFKFHAQKPAGKNIFCDGSDLSAITDGTYDFVLSSHNLEHFANPVKALKEWQRVTKHGGSLILVLPYYKYTFDHKRSPTPVAQMLHDYEQGTSEADLSHLEEILKDHDLRRDPGAGSIEDFHRRSLANFENRCLHQHVFDCENIKELLTSLGMKVLIIEFAWPFHIFAIAKM
jgi:SAM-dependent methyltransferase